MEIKYKILEKSEDVLDTKILKTGGQLELTPREIKAGIERGEKFLKEIEGKQKFYEATKKNIENSDPEVMELSERTLTAAYLYREAIGFINEATKKSLELRESIETDKKALEDIKEQCNLKI